MMTKRAKTFHDWAITIFSLSMIPGIFIAAEAYGYIAL